MSLKQVLLWMKNSYDEREYPYELKDPIARPDDIIDAVERSKQTGDHSEIHNILKDRKINLVTPIEEEIDGVKKKRTIARKVLEDAVNGNKIVKTELDIHVTALDDKKDSIDYALQIDFEGILCKDTPKQTMLVYELLDLRVAKGNQNMAAFTSLIKHPVVALFIVLKWKKTKMYFYAQSLIFISFLLLYSSFIIYLFNKPEDSLAARMSNKFLTNMDTNFFICEVFFLIFFISLSAIEIYQAIKLKKQYFKELENYIEWVVLVSALITMLFKEIILQSNWEAAVIRGICAVGICAAWLELIFIIGRYPFRGGDFSIMFYNIIKKLVRYVIAMFLMTIGFAFAFMIVHYGHVQDSFENPIKSSIMTLTIALGEFNFEGLYNNFKNDSTSRGFAMVLLVLLILFGTITMVNLFIAVIISDITQLREDVYTQNLINMAQCSILVEELLPPCILTKMRVEDKTTVCMHDLCPRGCKGTKLPPNMKPVYEELQKIARENYEEKEKMNSRRNGSSIQTQTVIIQSGRVF